MLVKSWPIINARGWLFHVDGSRGVQISTSVSESSLRIIFVLVILGGRWRWGGGGVVKTGLAFIKEEAFDREGKGDFALNFLFPHFFATHLADKRESSGVIKGSSQLFRFCSDK